ncbi:MAG: Ribonuclease Z [Syntrophaceae bacterium PtaU1.Bin231]|nr:MAG: Ribonuclease Z [Syntrophaceae bacterium PtaU1.Bin231]
MQPSRRSLTPLRIRFLGSGDNFGSGGRFQACILVEAPDARFLLDCGASSLIAMRRYGISTEQVDAILISHLHGDHFGGIPFFVLDGQLISRRTRPLVVAGPPGLEERTRLLMEAMYPGMASVPRKFPVTYVEMEEERPVTVGTLVVTPFKVIHGSGAPSYALRVDCSGRILSYSGDTEWTDTLVRAAADADLFICESYFYDKQMKNHISYRTLQEHKGELTSKRIILTHLGEDLLSRLSDVEMECAEDGKILEL